MFCRKEKEMAFYYGFPWVLYGFVLKQRAREEEVVTVVAIFMIRGVGDSLRLVAYGVKGEGVRGVREERERDWKVKQRRCLLSSLLSLSSAVFF